MVDHIIIDQVTVTNQSAEFYNLTSVNSNFTNTNATYNARADFYGLDVGLTIYNVNTDTVLFTSASGSQNYNASWISGQVLRIISSIPSSAQGRIACNKMIIQFGGFVVFIGLLGTIILLGGIMITLARSFTGNGTTEGLGKLFAGLLIVVIIGVLIIVALVIYNNLCGII